MQLLKHNDDRFSSSSVVFGVGALGLRAEERATLAVRDPDRSSGRRQTLATRREPSHGFTASWSTIPRLTSRFVPPHFRQLHSAQVLSSSCSCAHRAMYLVTRICENNMDSS